MDDRKEAKQPLFLAIASAADHGVRHIGSSGGVITAVIKHLFETEQIASTVSYAFSGSDLFVPYLAYSFDEYRQTGSVYHEVDLPNFLRRQIADIRSPIFVTCLPCEARAIRHILAKNRIESIIMVLVCSGQLTKEATYDFLARHNIAVGDVASFRYRGHGWPGGMTVTKNDGETLFFDNLSSDWLYFFHSTIYNLDKCFKCTDTFGIHGDAVVADPWLKEYKEREKEGCSIVAIHDERFHQAFQNMINAGLIDVHEAISLETFHATQKRTVEKKRLYYGNKKLISRLVSIYRSPLYKRFFVAFPKLHLRIHRAVFSRLAKK